MVLGQVISQLSSDGVEHTERLFQRLRALLKRAAIKPSPESVHRLRTTIRRVETVLRAQAADQRGATRKLLKQLARVRRRAGKVRDLDVQMIALRGINVEVSRRDLGILRRQLGKTHAKRQRKLQAAVEEELSGGLARRMNRVLKTLASASPTAAPGRDYVAAALRRFRALAEAYPEFTEANLHEFRIRCKRVRYLAELAAEGPPSQAALAQLRRIQDSIGEWHDWVALAETADRVLPHPNSPLLSILRAQRRMRFLGALRTTLDAKQKLLAMSAAALGPKKPAAASHPDPHAKMRAAAVA